mgnify:CR=1 FL=1
MKRLIISIVVFGALISGCSKSDMDGYWKITLTADISVSNDASQQTGGEIPRTYYPEGYLGAVLYFNASGGDVVQQECFITVNSVFFPGCTAEIVSETSNIPVGLLATLEVKDSGLASSYGDSKNKEINFRISKPIVHPLDIRMTCGSSDPTIESDYGSIISSLTAPFVLDQWIFSQISEELYTSTRTGYTYPPTWSSDITFSFLAEHVESL